LGASAQSLKATMKPNTILPENRSNYIPALIVITAYVAAQILSDISSLRIILFFGLSMDAGTFIYPITFTLRDLVHKLMGIKAARILILACAVINLFMALFFWFVSILPADPSVGAQTEFAKVLSPVWRIVLASIFAEVISELIDTEVYRLWMKKVTTRKQWSRVLASNGVSIPIDSILFAFIAFAGQMPLAVVWSIVLSNVIVKFATTFVSLPLIYAVPERVD